MRPINYQLYFTSLLLSLCLFLSAGLWAQYGYTARVNEVIWDGAGGEKNQSLSSEGVVTNGGAAFLLESLMPANPLNNDSLFRFDYKIVQHIHTPLYTGLITYFVNSRDGSIAMAAADNPALKQLMPQSAGEPHFAIRKANGNLLLCGMYKNEQAGRIEKRGVDLGKDTELQIVMTNLLWHQMSWMNTAEALPSSSPGDALTPAQLSLLQSTAVEALRGQVAAASGSGVQIIDMYMVPYPCMERVSTFFMGLNTGIIKNLKKSINQLVLYAVVRDVMWKGHRTNLHFYLQSLHRAVAEFRPGGYRIMTAFNKAGIEKAASLQEKLMEITGRLKQLQQLIADCPKGREGNTCREPYHKEVKELQKQMETMGRDFIRQQQMQE